ncbi:MAG: hypothetical protein ACSHYA_02650 [Opitutaceae bacterium]
MNLDRIHEKEEFSLKLREEFRHSDMPEILASRKYSREDDFAYLPRHSPMPWEAISLVSIDFFRGNEPVYLEDHDFERLQISFLPASTPIEEWEIFFNELLELSKALNSSIEYKSNEMNEDTLRALSALWEKEILDESGDLPGSETVGILLDLEYQKNRV